MKIYYITNLIINVNLNCGGSYIELSIRKSSRKIIRQLLLMYYMSSKKKKNFCDVLTTSKKH